MEEAKHILITGASRRLGLFLSETFIANDCRVSVVTRKPSKALEVLAEKAPDRFKVYQVPDYSSSSIETLIHNIAGNCTRLHALIHNASVFEQDGEEGFSINAYLSLFEMHMAMPAHLNTGLAPLLSNPNKPGSIIHITDIYADNPNPNYALYCSTKAALENLTKSFAKKLAPGVRVNSVQPGPIQFLPSHSEQDKKKVLDETLLAYEGGYMPVYQAICGLIDNPYMTGATLKVDGGRALGRG